MLIVCVSQCFLLVLGGVCLTDPVPSQHARSHYAGGGFGTPGGGGFGTPGQTGGGLFGGASPAPGSGGFGFGGASPAPNQNQGGGGLFGAASPAPGGGMFGAQASTPGFGAPAAAGGGLFGASAPAQGGGMFGAPAPAAGGGMFGAPAPAAGGGMFGASAPAQGGGMFGAPAPAAGGGMFGAFAPAQGGGMFGASAPAQGGGMFGASAPAQGGGMFGAPAPAQGGGMFGAPAPAQGGGLFGAPAPAQGGGLFGAPAPAQGGGMFGQSTPAMGGGMFGGAQNQLAVQQPQQGMLATVDGQPVKHFTQWGELAPHSQQQLQLIESQIVEAREDSKLLDGITRLQGETGGSRTVGGAARQRSLERAAKAASDALKLLETQLWSDGERLGGLREAVVATLRDTEHARARLTRLKQAAAADDNASAYQRSHPGMAAPPDAAPVFIPPPRRPSVFLKNAVEKLYAAAEGFERGTLEMERNLRVTGRVHGHGAGGPGLEALLFALRGGFAKGDFGDFGDGGEGTGGDENTNDAALGHDLSWRAGPAELRAAVENAQRYFNKVGTDLARLHERVRRAKAEHLALLRRRGKYFPFTTYRRLIAHTILTFLFYNLSGTGVQDSMVNQLLTKIDGVDSLNNILLIGMTNRRDMLDEAILRPGRLEVHIEIGLPDEPGRHQILKIHSAKMSENEFLGTDVDITDIAKRTKNFSGAEIEGLVKSAVSFALARQVDFQNLSAMEIDEGTYCISQIQRLFTAPL